MYVKYIMTMFEEQEMQTDMISDLEFAMDNTIAGCFILVAKNEQDRKHIGTTCERVEQGMLSNMSSDLKFTMN
jgi:hypothetical protein